MDNKINNDVEPNPILLKLNKVLDGGNYYYKPKSIALKIAGIYMLMGALWILLSDKLLAFTVNDKETITFVSMIKGWLYVLLTGGLIFFLVFIALKRLRNKENGIAKSFQELKVVHDELAASEQFGTAIIDKMLDAFALHKVILDSEGKPCDYEYIDLNPAFEVFTGLKKEETVGKRYRELILKSEIEKTDWVSIYGKVAITGTPISFESYTDAFDKWVVVNAYCPKDEYFITVFHDISDVKRSEVELRDKNEELTLLYEELIASEEELRQQLDELTYHQEKLQLNAYHDTLTGLPNRLLLYENLAKHLKEYPNERKALLFIDSDNFKFINDTMGHSFGDQLITDIGRRLSSLFDNKNSVHRLGGDEFIICYNGFTRLEEVEECAKKIIQRFNTPFEIGNSILHTTVSVGISMYPENGDNADELMRSADIAMYRAKALGKNNYVFYNYNMQEIIRERMMIEKHLRNAIQKNEFQLYYQPQLDIKTGKISGFEGLLRWNNPELGFVSPLKFIGIAEETHLIISIGEWVVKNACLFLKQLNDIGYKDLTISVNVSILQLLQENFVHTVKRILELIEIDPVYLELEITESILMESYQTISEKLFELKDMGVKIALDDFGKGYSSLSYLKQLPINTLKIDKSFIDSINSGESSDSLTGAIVMIGRKMGLTILAEGVENQKQMDYLTKHGCHKVQGYLVSKPLPQEEVIKLYEDL